MASQQIVSCPPTGSVLRPRCPDCSQILRLRTSVTALPVSCSKWNRSPIITASRRHIRIAARYPACGSITTATTCFFSASLRLFNQHARSVAVLPVNIASNSEVAKSTVPVSHGCLRQNRVSSTPNTGGMRRGCVVNSRVATSTTAFQAVAHETPSSRATAAVERSFPARPII
jgi:hypothetical protein